MRKSIDIITKDLFNNVSEKDILSQRPDRKLFYKGLVLSNEHKNGIIEEAKLLQKLELLNMLFDEMTYFANKKMFIDSIGLEDIQAGKAMLWAVNKLKSKINFLATELK